MRREIDSSTYNRRTLDIVDNWRRGEIRAVHNCHCIVDITFDMNEPLN